MTLPSRSLKIKSRLCSVRHFASVSLVLGATIFLISPCAGDNPGDLHGEYSSFAAASRSNMAFRAGS
jgi:hypothetical protein